MNLYLITNTSDGTMYVGKTTQTIAKRWSAHLAVARRGVNTHLYRALRKYGVENFTIDPLILIEDDFADEAQLNDGERLMIRLLRVNCRLYNETSGGDGLSNPSQEVRHKMSEARKRRIITGETRRKISEAQKGRTVSEETRRKIGAAHKGKSVSEESRRKLSEAKTGKPLSSEHRQSLMKNHCKNGHERSPDNVSKNRQCRACERVRNAAYRAARKTEDKNEV